MISLEWGRKISVKAKKVATDSSFQKTRVKGEWNIAHHVELE